MQYINDELCFGSQGIQFLIENDLLKNTSDDIAQFLCKGEGLNKTAIGDYLGERCVRLYCMCGVFSPVLKISLLGLADMDIMIYVLEYGLYSQVSVL